MRIDRRKSNQLRPIRIKTNYLKRASGSCLIEMGETKVICTASVEEKVPPFLKGKGKGWITAEYGMLPGSCGERISREASRGKQSGRTVEIQRLIGRSLRAVCDLEKLGERMITVDADVLQGDGGTRTASITGCFVALQHVIRNLEKKKLVKGPVIREGVAAVSVGVVDGKPLLDLCYREDVAADVDMNLVMTSRGRLIEIQGTAERVPFEEVTLNKLIGLGKKGIREIFAEQKKHLAK